MRSVVFASLALFAGLSAPAPATARPADCLLVIGAQTLIDGRCEFDSGEGGSFRMESSSHVALLMVSSPGVGEGMWTRKPEVRDAYRDVPDLRRSGACWTNGRDSMCAWAVGQRPAPPPASPRAEPVQSKGAQQLHTFPFQRAGIWEIGRVSDEPAGRRTLGCLALVRDESRANLRFALDNSVGIIGFRDDTDLMGLPERFAVRVQFGTNGRTFPFQAEITDDDDGRWANITAPVNFDSGLDRADRLIIRTPSGVLNLPIPDRGQLWPALGRCMERVR